MYPPMLRRLSYPSKRHCRSVRPKHLPSRWKSLAAWSYRRSSMCWYWAPYSDNLARSFDVVLAQLAILAAAAVIAARVSRLAILGVLAGNAQADAGNCLSACQRNLVAAFCAMSQTRSLRQATLRKADRILDAPSFAQPVAISYSACAKIGTFSEYGRAIPNCK